jgi:hypothetical protein
MNVILSAPSAREDLGEECRRTFGFDALSSCNDVPHEGPSKAKQAGWPQGDREDDGTARTRPKIE